MKKGDFKWTQHLCQTIEENDEKLALPGNKAQWHLGETMSTLGETVAGGGVGAKEWLPRHQKERTCRTRAWCSDWDPSWTRTELCLLSALRGCVKPRLGSCRDKRKEKAHEPISGNGCTAKTREGAHESHRRQARRDAPDGGRGPHGAPADPHEWFLWTR